MPQNDQRPHDDSLTWWFRAAITGAGTAASLTIAIVLFCNALRSHTLSHITVSDVIAATSAAEAFALLGVTTYAIGRGHGAKAHQRRSVDDRTGGHAS
jgi:hypothetical protein